MAKCNYEITLYTDNTEILFNFKRPRPTITSRVHKNVPAAASTGELNIFVRMLRGLRRCVCVPNEDFGEINNRSTKVFNDIDKVLR